MFSLTLRRKGGLFFYYLGVIKGVGKVLQIIKINFFKQACFAAVMIFSSVVNAATYTVLNKDDSGVGSLRQAILDANANPGLDSIDFNLGACPQTIKPLTGLPDITSPVDINGYTQPGAAVATDSSAATLCIEISGELVPAPFGPNGLSLTTGSSGSAIRGLVINRFKRGTLTAAGGSTITITSGSGSHWIAGNYLNVNEAGSASFFSSGYSSVGFGLNDGGSGGNTIGHDPSGPNSLNPAADRNIISGAGTGRSGITIGTNSAANQIRGNYIGTDVTGVLNLGNPQHGLVLTSLNNTVEENLISGNTNIGCLSIAGGGTWIESNLVGTDVTGTIPLRNGVGVGLGTSHNTVIGNVIAFNTNDGLNVVPSFSPAPFPVSNAILSNSIFGNGSLGIDLIAVRCGPPLFQCDLGAPQLNDPLDSDAGFANNLQNFPVIDGKRSFMNPALVQVWGSLDSKASQDYLIQVFSNDLADPSGYGEGKAMVGEMTVTTDASGHANFHLLAKLGVAVGSIITATATDLLTMDTSEFSKWENVDSKGSPTAYENAAGAAGGDGLGNMEGAP